MKGKKRPQNRLSFLIVLFFNLVIMVVLAFFIRGRISPRCVSPEASALSLGVILLMLCHLFWRSFHLTIKNLGDAIKVGGFAVPIKVFVEVFDKLHPWMLSDLALWLLVSILSVAVGILGLSPLSPFRLPEELPIIQSISVRYLLNGTLIPFKPGDAVEIMVGEQVLVEAKTSQQADPLCTWHATKGTLQPTKGCSTLYSAPFDEIHDTLVILVQSPCKTRQTCVGLAIHVVQARP